MTTPEPNDLIEAIGMDPLAHVIAPRVPEMAFLLTDARWRLDRPPQLFDDEDPPELADLEPPGVDLGIADGQITFRLTQNVDHPTQTRVTTGHAADTVPEVEVGEEPDNPIYSGPYQLRDSSVFWQNVELPTDWGATDEVQATAILRGDAETADEYTIAVTLTNGEIIVSHTDGGTTTVDFTAPIETPGFTRAAPALLVEGETQFRFIRIESDAAGTDFWVYASTDGLLWLLLVHETMSADMQGAFLGATLEFSVTTSGNTATGSWVIGSINLLPVTTNFAGVYLQNEDQAGFSFNAGVWAQFGAPLDGPRSDYTWFPIEQQYRDAEDNIHHAWISALAYAADNPNKLYAVVMNKDLLFISTNGGFTWTEKVMPFASRPTPDTVGHRSPVEIFDIAAPGNGELLVLSSSTLTVEQPGIYHSTDDGDTWVRTAEFTANAALPTTRIWEHGGMQTADSKVWWAEKTAATNVVPEGAPVPRYRIIGSDSMEWFVEIRTKPAEAPFLEVPALSGATETVLEDGTRSSAAFMLVTITTPGFWAPNVVDGEAVLFEDGIQTRWQNPMIDGIYGSVGHATTAMPRVLWQPGWIPDSNVAEYWALTDNMAWYRRQLRLAALDPPQAEPPPPLPNLGAPNGGQWLKLREVYRNDPVPEPVNSKAGGRVEADGLLFDPWPLDLDATVVPKYPASTATVWTAVMPLLARDGGKLHMVFYDDLFTGEPGPDGNPGTTKRTSYTMNGTTSVVVFDAEPADYAQWGPGAFGLGSFHLMTPAYQMGGGTWQIVSGEPGYLQVDSAFIGPPGREKNLDYLRWNRPTWQFGDVPYVSAGGSVTIDPTDDSRWPDPAGGILIATYASFGDGSLPDVPSGWTLVPDTYISSAAYSGAEAGRAPNPAEPESPEDLLEGRYKLHYGLWIYWATGSWQSIIRQYKRANVICDLASMSQMVVWRPIDWSSPAVTLALPAASAEAPYWVAICSLGIVNMPGGGPLYTTTDETWSVKRASFDGSGQETVGSINFTAPLLPDRLQVRPFDNNLCLVSTRAGNHVYRVQAGSGATSIWPATLAAQPWDAIALDDLTYIAVANAVVTPTSGALAATQTRRANRGYDPTAR